MRTRQMQQKATKVNGFVKVVSKQRITDFAEKRKPKPECQEKGK